MISRILFVLLTWPATSAGKQLGRLLVPLTRRDAGLIWPLLPNPEFSCGKRCGQATHILLILSTKMTQNGSPATHAEGALFDVPPQNLVHSGLPTGARCPKGFHAIRGA